MRRIVGRELEQIKPFFDLAAQAAKDATCHRAKCGSVIVKDGEVIGRGYNSPPLNDESRRTCYKIWNHSKKPNYDLTCCIHAEWRAILEASKNNSSKIHGSVLYFMRIDDNGSSTDAGEPYCTTCSRLAMEAAVSKFALWNNNGADIYSSREYDRRSYDFYKSNL